VDKAGRSTWLGDFFPYFATGLFIPRIDCQSIAKELLVATAVFR
jgi:hypothetical protein